LVLISTRPLALVCIDLLWKQQFLDLTTYT
jgi:hypothetical protein